MDFINIPVDYAIEPAQPRLVLGGIACLQTPITSNRGKRKTQTKKLCMYYIGYICCWIGAIMA